MAAAAGGCQPKNAGSSGVGVGGSSATSAHAASREPVRRVEVINRSAAQWAESVVGRKCRVQLRRDALGMAANVPDGMNSRWASESTIEGTIAEVTDQWLVLQGTGKRIVVPHASILLIELQD
jgi:hypothetical protein